MAPYILNYGTSSSRGADKFITHFGRFTLGPEFSSSRLSFYWTVGGRQNQFGNFGGKKNKFLNFARNRTKSPLSSGL